MDKLDIYELDSDTKIQTTVNELRSLYAQGCVDGEHDEWDNDILIQGEIL